MNFVVYFQQSFECVSIKQHFKRLFEIKLLQ